VDLIKKKTPKTQNLLIVIETAKIHANFKLKALKSSPLEIKKKNPKKNYYYLETMLSSKHVLCIRGLSQEDSESEIYSLLSKYGTLTHLEIIKPKDNKGKKNALAHYQEEAQANYARSSLHNQKFGSNYLFVDYYDPYSKQFQGFYPSQIQIPMQIPNKPNLNYNPEEKDQYMSFLREKKDFKTEKKIIKFTEVDKDHKNEKTTLYTKKNLEKMISSSNNSRLPSQVLNPLNPPTTNVPKEELFVKNSPMVTQNYYINGTMNNQQNVYLKSQINFIHFLPFGVGNNAPTIEQIKQSYLEKPSETQKTTPQTVANNPNVEKKQTSIVDHIAINLNMPKEMNLNNAHIEKKKIVGKMELERTKEQIPEKFKEFKTLLNECKMELDFREVKNAAHMRKKLRRLYHKLLHKVLKTSHCSHQNNDNENNAKKSNSNENKEKNSNENYAKNSNEKNEKNSNEKNRIGLEKSNFIEKCDINMEKIQKTIDFGHISHKISIFHTAHQEIMKSPLFSLNEAKEVKETKESKEAKEAKESKETKESKESKETQEIKTKETKLESFVLKEDHQLPKTTATKIIEKPIIPLIKAEEMEIEKPIKMEEPEKKEEMSEKKLEEDLLKNKKMKNVLNYMMNGGDIQNLRDILKKKGLNSQN